MSEGKKSFIFLTKKPPFFSTYKIWKTALYFSRNLLLILRHWYTLKGKFVATLKKVWNWFVLLVQKTFLLARAVNNLKIIWKNVENGTNILKIPQLVSSVTTFFQVISLLLDIFQCVQICQIIWNMKQPPLLQVKLNISKLAIIAWKKSRKMDIWSISNIAKTIQTD